jgi:hypothetical protein
MKNRIKWIVGVGALVLAPLSLISAPTANAGQGACATATLGRPVIDAPFFFVNCSTSSVFNCLSWHNPLTAPVDQAAAEAVQYGVCNAL